MMKKMFLLSAVCVMSLTTTLFGQTHTQSISFDDGVGPGNAGTYLTNDHFSFDVYLTYNGYNSYGFSLRLEAPQMNNFAASISITGETFGPVFSESAFFQTFPAPFDLSWPAQPGYLADHVDLGAILPGKGPIMPQPPGTYFVAHISFAINGAIPGVYTLRSTTIGGQSEVSDQDFHDNLLPVEDYTITIIPEPATLALLSLGAIGLVAASRIRKA